MKLKKVNAVLGLLPVPLLLAHIGYLTFCYLTMTQPVVKDPLSYPMMIVFCLHAVCGMSVLFLHPDGTRADLYVGLNRRTVVQRVTAALSLPLLILHINTWNLLTSTYENGQWFLFGLLLFSEAVFYAVILAHTATSWTNALVTLGWLTSMEKKKKLDRVGGILLLLVFLVTVYAVLSGQIAMFAS